MKINIQYNNELNNTAGNSLRYMYMDDHNVGCELFFSLRMVFYSDVNATEVQS